MKCWNYYFISFYVYWFLLLVTMDIIFNILKLKHSSLSLYYFNFNDLLISAPLQFHPYTFGYWYHRHIFIHCVPQNIRLITFKNVLVSFFYFLFFLLLCNYSCMPFLPIPTPHPSWTHLPPPSPPSPLVLSMCPL